MAETLNMMSITIERFVQEIKLDLEDGNYDPMIGIGLSGIGKTMSISEVAAELGIGFCELRLVTLTETDMLGIPYKDEHGRTNYASNALLPSVERDGECGILVLDEITSANRSVRAAAYQLLDSKRALGNYQLPPKWKVIGLGNGPDDGGVFSGMEAAFLSRCTCYRIEPDLNVWKKWAVKNEVNPSVIAFLSFMPNMLHDFDADEIASVFPCPRSWTALSTRLNAREKRSKTGILDIDQVEIYAAGSVGVKVASQFSAFYAYNGKTISAEDILDGKASVKDVANIEAEVIFLVIQQLVKAIDKLFKTTPKVNGQCSLDVLTKLVNVCKWFVGISQYRLEYAVLGIVDLAGASDDFNNTIINDDRFIELYPEFIEWYINQDLEKIE